MSELLEGTPHKSISWLVSQIHEKEIALPDFQRDFVWDPPATEKLLVSIANDYPAGSLLAIRNDQEYFAAREFQGAPPLDGVKPTYLILDGQQRLSSMYQALYGVGDYLYFLDLNKVFAGEDIEDSIFHVRASAQRGWQARVVRDCATIEGQASRMFLPLKVIFGNKHERFSDWMRKVRDLSEDPRTIEKSLDHVEKRLIRRIEDYQFPVTIISGKTPQVAVCTIFETLNRTGIKLSVFDLLAARFWPKNVKLRDMWKASSEEYPIIQDFQIDPYYILQILALLRPEGAPSCKNKDVIRLESDHVARSWAPAIQGLAQTLKIIQDDCGVMLPKWLPYTTLLIPFAAIIVKHCAIKGLDAGEARQKLVRWFWCSVFGQVYENSPNSQAAKDLAEVGAWISGGKIPDDISAFTFEPQTLREVTPKQRALYSGVISLVLSKHPRDFQKMVPLSRALIEEKHVDDHHIFPDAYLEKTLSVLEKKKRDCVLNRTLIDRDTNKSLQKRDPADYFTEMRKRLGEQQFDELLASHLLEPSPESALFKNDYDAFLDWRCDVLGKAILGVTRADSQ